MNKPIICISAVLLFISCHEREYKSSVRFSYSDIPEKIHLNGTVVDFEDIYKPVRLYIRDSILFTVNQSQEYFVTTYNLNSTKKIGDFVPFGSGPNEISYLNAIQFTDSSVWIFNQMGRNLFKYGYEQFLYNREIVPRMKVKTDDADRVLVADSLLLTTSLSRREARFSIYDMTGKFLRDAGELPDAGIDMTELEMLESNFCDIVLNPVDKSVFVAYMNTDLIEIYDKNGNLKSRMHGPEHYFPVRKETSSDGVKRVRSVAGETRDAYFWPVAFEDEIWAIYSGKVYDPSVSNAFLSNDIIVFDWNGRPVRQYTVDIPFLSIAIDRLNSAIYGITLNPEFSIVKYNYGREQIIFNSEENK
jgi:hypothetical protein